MHYSDFDIRILRTFCSRYMIVAVVILIIAVTLTIELVYYHKTKSSQGISIWNLLSKKPVFAQRLSIKQQISRDLIAIVILSVYLCYSIIPIYNDVSNQQYIEVDALYSRTARDADGNLFSNGQIYIEVSGEVIRLELPEDWTEDEFPEGTFWGTIWYSKESKMVLSIVLQTAESQNAVIYSGTQFIRVRAATSTPTTP